MIFLFHGNITKNKVTRHMGELLLSLVIPILFIDIISYIMNVQVEIAKRTYDMRKVYVMGLLAYLVLGFVLSLISIHQRKRPNKYTTINLGCALFVCVIHSIFYLFPMFRNVVIPLFYKCWSFINIKVCFLLIGFYSFLLINNIIEGKKLKKNNEYHENS